MTPEDRESRIHTAGLRAMQAEAERINRDWQPIETAPKDGSAVLIACVDGDVGAAMYSAWERDENGRVIGLDPEVGCDLKDRWEWVGEGFEVDSPPTHWMPMPPHPAKSKG